MVRTAKPEPAGGDAVDADAFDLRCEVCSYKLADEPLAQYLKEGDDMVESEQESKSATKDANSRHVSALAKIWSMKQEERDARMAEDPSRQTQSVSISDVLDGPAPDKLRIPFERSVSLKKRFEAPPHQEADFFSLRPHHQDVFTKHRRRCPHCRKFLVKPVVNPKLTTYEKTSAARTLIPRCTISTPGGLKVGEWHRLLLVFSNPHESALAISVASAKPDELRQKERAAGDANTSEAPSDEKSNVRLNEEANAEFTAELKLLRESSTLDPVSVLFENDALSDKAPISYRTVRNQASPDVLKEANTAAFPVEIRPTKSLDFSVPLSVSLKSLDTENPLVPFKPFTYILEVVFSGPEAA